MRHVWYTGRWGGSVCVVERGRDEELGHQAVEEYLRNLLVAQVARVFIVHIVWHHEGDKRVPVARLHCRDSRGVHGHLDAVIAHVLAQVDPILLPDVLRHLRFAHPAQGAPSF